VRRKENATIRQPYAVLVLLFRLTVAGPEYAVFRRADDGNWQGVSGVERSCFAASASWPTGFYIVPKHFFAMDVGAERAAMVLSAEHDDFGWHPYERSYVALRYDDDKTALWELDARLRAGDLPTRLG